MFKKILVPLDGSPFSEQALPYATSLAQMYGSTLTLLHVTEHTSLHLAAELPDVYQQVQSAQLEQYGNYLNEKSQSLRAEGYDVNTVLVERGAIAENIIQQATDGKSDIIVMSTHGRSGVQRFLLGSVAERVLRHATLPVMLINADSAESE